MVFANEDDDYYTDSYIKTDLDYYLYSNLLAMRYDYLFSFYGESFRNCRLKPLDNISSEAFEGASQSGGFMSNLFGGLRRGGSFDDPGNAVRGKERRPDHGKGMTVQEANFVPVMKRMLDFLRRNTKAAVIIPIGIFNDIARFPELLAELKRISDKNYHDNNRHAIIITASLYANESLRFFRPTDDLAESDVNIFRDAELFPELEPYYTDLYRFGKNCYVYDAVNIYLGDKSVFYRPFSYENVRRMITRCCLNSSITDEVSRKKIEALTAAVYCYYNSVTYRCEHSGLLPENQKRILAAVEEWIRNDRSLRQRLDEASLEFYDKPNVYKYVCNNYPDCIDTESSINMIGGSDKLAEIETLRSVRSIYLNRFGELHPGLERVIALLSKPAAELSVSFSAVNCRKKVIELLSDGIIDTMTGRVNVRLLDYAVNALEYYFSMFQTSAPANEEAVRARDESFGLYRNLVELVRILTDKITRRDSIEEKLHSLEQSGMEDSSLRDSKAVLDCLNSYIDSLEKNVEISERLIAAAGSGNTNGELIRNMEKATKDIAVLKKRKNEFN